MSSGGPLPLLTGDDLRIRPNFDAIVIGGGAAGLVACRQLTQSGMHVLLLDAGRPRSILRAPLQALISAGVRAVAQPFWYEIAPAWLAGAGRKALRLAGQVRQPRQSACFAWPLDPDAFVDDRDNPYETPPDAEFVWFRSRQLGGKMVIPGHGMQYYRFGPEDFSSPSNPDAVWPIDSAELEPWYNAVESLLNLHGGEAPNSRAASSRLSIVHPLAPSEARLRDQIEAIWPNCGPALGVFAPWPDLLGDAIKSGRLRIRQGAVAQSIDVDAGGKLKGATWFDCAAGVSLAAHAPVVFVCASTLESTRILMNSRSKEFPRGLGGDSEALGRYLMDHVLVTGQSIGSSLGPTKVDLVPGRCLHVPAIDSKAASGAAIGLQLYQSSLGSNRSMLNMVSFSPMTPRADNHMMLHPTRKDRYGVPIPRIECRFSAREMALAQEQRALLLEIARATGATQLMLDPSPAPAGYAIHECGTARMGASPKTSVLDVHNVVWGVPGLYVTDGASLPTVGPHNLTLTIMALTARAAAHATGHALRENTNPEARARAAA